MLKESESFAMLLKDKKQNISDILTKISSRKHLAFNIVKSDYGIEYVLYTKPTDKEYIFNMCINKHLKLIWKDKVDFYLIDFSTNSKGNIVAYLSDEDTGAGKIEGSIMIPNIKAEFLLKCSKIQLVSPKLLDDKNPYNYEGFCFYIKI